MSCGPKWSISADVIDFKMDWDRFQAVLVSSIKMTAYGQYQAWYGQWLKRKLAQEDFRDVMKKAKAQ